MSKKWGAIQGHIKCFNIFDKPTIADDNRVEQTETSLVLSFQTPWPAAGRRGQTGV